jgi:hypothetical protein
MSCKYCWLDFYFIVLPISASLIVSLICNMVNNSEFLSKKKKSPKLKTAKNG